MIGRRLMVPVMDLPDLNYRSWSTCLPGFFEFLADRHEAALCEITREAENFLHSCELLSTKALPATDMIAGAAFDASQLLTSFCSVGLY